VGVMPDRFRAGDVYLFYDQESVMFRWDRRTRKCYRKFVGHREESEIPHSNKLFNDATRFGQEISRDQYLGMR